MRFYDRLTQAVLRRPVELGLRAPVGMMQQSRRWPALRDRHRERIADQSPLEARVHRPADDAPRVQVQDHASGILSELKLREMAGHTRAQAGPSPLVQPRL